MESNICVCKCNGQNMPFQVAITNIVILHCLFDYHDELINTIKPSQG